MPVSKERKKKAATPSKKKAATPSKFSFDEERLRNNSVAESTAAKKMVKEARKMRKGAIEMRESLHKKSV